jgi:uncharacterized membrane protein
MSPVTALPPTEVKRSNKPIFLVAASTGFAAAAQIMMKFGAGHPMPKIDLAHPATIIALALAILTNAPLFFGYSMNAGMAVLLILALKDGQLSILYPIISLSYVWVNLLSMYFFHEHMNFFKAIGIVLIIGGVGLLGKVSSRA